MQHKSAVVAAHCSYAQLPGAVGNDLQAGFKQLAFCRSGSMEKQPAVQADGTANPAELQCALSSFG